MAHINSHFPGFFKGKVVLNSLPKLPWDMMVGWLVSLSPTRTGAWGLIWNSIFADITTLKWGHTRLGSALRPMTGVFVRTGEGAQKVLWRRPCEDKGWDWNYSATSQRISEVTRSWKTRRNSFLEPSEEAEPCWHLVSRRLDSINVRE